MSDHIADLFALQHWRARAAELERERDEARAQVERLERERDEARTEVERLREQLQEARDAGRAQQSVIAAHEDARRQAERERDEAGQTLCEAHPHLWTGDRRLPQVARDFVAEHKRVQARAEDYHRSLVAQSALLHTTSNERDEARAEVERLRAERDELLSDIQTVNRLANLDQQQLIEARALLREITSTYQVWSVLTESQRARLAAALGGKR